MTQEALKLALEALEKLEKHNRGVKLTTVKTGVVAYPAQIAQEAITAIKEALAQPEQEPVAWPCLIAEADFSQDTVTLTMQCTDYKVSAGKHWLSTTPPQRKPLTDEQLEAMAEKYVTNCYFDTLKYARAIEAAHGIKGKA